LTQHGVQAQDAGHKTLEERKVAHSWQVMNVILSDRSWSIVPLELQYTADRHLGWITVNGLLNDAALEEGGLLCLAEEAAQLQFNTLT
jgi:hypothetical protein